jgi:tRNA G18 (ribose-2'-O)-methylase SpoU
VVQFQKIDSFDLPELAPYRTMKRPLEHQRQGIFIAEGVKVVRRLLASDFTIVSVVLPEKWLQEFKPLLKARREDVRVYVVEKKGILEALTGFSMFQGVLAVGKIPVAHRLADVLSRSAKPRLFVAIDALNNAENLGALVRNCVAFNVQALLVGETSSSPFLRRAVRNSMGTIFQLPVVDSASLVQTLCALRAEAIRCVAAHPHVEGRTLTQAHLAGECCIVFGSEGVGISPAVLDICDEAAAIPMAPAVDSLNVGAAAAVFLYEANRQRGKM